jgi:proteasome lid subunit RPN8/RPN11
MTSATPESFYTWEVEGKPVVVRLELDLVDRLLKEVLRGFGLVPRRGVEMGGILLGTVHGSDGRLTVHVEDFEPVLCQHTKGMTWVLSESEETRFEETLSRWNRKEGRRTCAVGFYRSHTREGLRLSQEDLSLLESYFPEPSAIALLIKPFATRTSVGAIFFREDGHVRSELSYREFPFRRAELSGEVPPEAARSAPELNRPQINGTPHRPPVSPPVRRAELPEAPPAPVAAPPLVPDALRFGLPGGRRDGQTGKLHKTGWVWVPLSFIFLLLGTVLGLQVSMSVKTQSPAAFRQDAYTLGLTVTPSGETLHLRWDRHSPAVQASSRGTLSIIDGGVEKVVSLDITQLQTGGVIYRRATGRVRFRLEVNARERVSVAETVDFGQ